MPNTYDIGDSVTLVSTWADTVTGGLIDPSSIYLTLKWPDLTCGSWELTDFVKVSSGHYQFTVPTEPPNHWMVLPESVYSRVLPSSDFGFSLPLLLAVLRNLARRPKARPT